MRRLGLTPRRRLSPAAATAVAILAAFLAAAVEAAASNHRYYYHDAAAAAATYGGGVEDEVAPEYSFFPAAFVLGEPQQASYRAVTNADHAVCPRGGCGGRYQPYIGRGCQNVYGCDSRSTPPGRRY